MTDTMVAATRHRNDTHFFRAGDGLPLTLIRVRGEKEPTKPPVMLVHGAGVRAELFRPPVRRTIVDALVADGWDVWLLNWRASIDLDPVPWTLDDAAAYDRGNAATDGHHTRVVSERCSRRLPDDLIPHQRAQTEGGCCPGLVDGDFRG